MLCSSCNKVEPEENYKTCAACKLRAIEFMRARKKRRLAEPVPEGMRRCGQCSRNRPLDHYISSFVRRTKLTVWCKSCRDINRRVSHNPGTTKGACRETWKDWQRNNPCPCGETRCIEGIGWKTHRCGNSAWWAWNGGVSALQSELKECRPLCRWCNRMRRTPMHSKNTHRQRYEVINEEKLRRGKCLLCPRVCAPENTQGFDFDHRDPLTKKHNIARMILLADFETLYPEEVLKCDLLCCMCHYDKTYGETSSN
jgi:hypothetical protein